MKPHSPFSFCTDSYPSNLLSFSSFPFSRANYYSDSSMSISLASLSKIFQRNPVATASAHVGNGTDLDWTPIPNPQQALLRELKKLYWDGVRRELIDIIFTLKTWQHEDFEKVALSDETDEEIYGFDTFLDQVNESSRDFALQYGEHHVLVPWLQHC